MGVLSQKNYQRMAIELIAVITHDLLKDGEAITKMPLFFWQKVHSTI